MSESDKVGKKIEKIEHEGLRGHPVKHNQAVAAAIHMTEDKPKKQSAKPTDDDDDNAGDDNAPKCHHCGGPGMYMGHFGPEHAIYRCRNCGAVFGFCPALEKPKEDDHE